MACGAAFNARRRDCAVLLRLGRVGTGFCDGRRAGGRGTGAAPRRSRHASPPARSDVEALGAQALVVGVDELLAVGGLLPEHHHALVPRPPRVGARAADLLARLAQLGRGLVLCGRGSGAAGLGVSVRARAPASPRPPGAARASPGAAVSRGRGARPGAPPHPCFPRPRPSHPPAGHDGGGQGMTRVVTRASPRQERRTRASWTDRMKRQDPLTGREDAPVLMTRGDRGGKSGPGARETGGRSDRGREGGWGGNARRGGSALALGPPPRKGATRHRVPDADCHHRRRRPRALAPPRAPRPARPARPALPARASGSLASRSDAEPATPSCPRASGRPPRLRAPPRTDPRGHRGGRTPGAAQGEWGRGRARWGHRRRRNAATGRSPWYAAASPRWGGASWLPKW